MTFSSTSASLRVLALLALPALLAPLAPSPARAYDTVLDVPLHEGRDGAVVGALEAVVPTTLRFRDATHADVTFRGPTLELRGSVDLAEGRAEIRSEQRLVLGGSAFHVEVEPGTRLALVDGLRRGVALETTLPIAGLDLTATRLRVIDERPASDEDQRDLEPCAPAYLWAQPRVQGPVIRTTQGARMTFARPSGVEGWSEIWVSEGGVWLRGYTWTARHCSGGYGTIGTIGFGRGTAASTARRALAADAFVASRVGAPWTVHVLSPMEVEMRVVDERTYFVFPVGGGIARVEGVVLP